jgi:hypothetical protein
VRHRLALAVVAVAALALVATLLIARSADKPRTPRPQAKPVKPPFAASAFWNRPLPANAPTDPRSPVYVAELERMRTRWATWINTDQYSVPVYKVPPRQPTLRVTLDGPDRALQAAWKHVPMPATARPAAGTDGHLVVWQPARDRMWEFWRATKQPDGWHASFGGRIDRMSLSPGYYTQPPSWGATATSLPLLGGLIRIDELRAGRIDHALALALPRARADVFSLPAQRTDGTDPRPGAIPEGTRFRIDPALDLDAIEMDPVTREMAEAAQRYGIVVRDTASSIAFYAEDPTPTGSNPYPGFFGGRPPSELLAEFPWQHLRALRTDVRSQPR